MTFKDTRGIRRRRNQFRYQSFSYRQIDQYKTYKESSREQAAMRSLELSWV